LSDICPFKIAVPTDPPVPLLPSPNTANIQRIVFNGHNPVLLRMLACQEANSTHNSSGCPYPDHKSPVANKLACNSPDKFSHLYIRHEQMDDTARSCVIVFIENTYFFDKDGLLQLFQNTVSWLGIAQEKPYFYIARYGKSHTTGDTGYNSKVLNMALKRIYKDYPDGEDICIIIPVGQRAQILSINHNRKFLVTVS
jgi:hypothetical protein